MIPYEEAIQKVFLSQHLPHYFKIFESMVLVFLHSSRIRETNFEVGYRIFIDSGNFIKKPEHRSNIEIAITFDPLDGFSSFDPKNEALEEFSRFRGFKYETYFRNINIFEHE